jgi:arginase
LAFLDGHQDFRHPGNSETVGAAAGEDLALVTGRGREDLTNPELLKPLVQEEGVVALGEQENDPETIDVLDTEVTVLDLAAVKKGGVTEAAGRAVDRFERNKLDGFWNHLDADVLDDEVMPAVDSPQPDGLGRNELIEMLRVLLASKLAASIEVTIFDPDVDPDGKLASAFAAITRCSEDDLLRQLTTVMTTTRFRQW